MADDRTVLSRRWILDLLGAFLLERVMRALAPQFLLYIYTLIALIFTGEIFLALSKLKLVRSYLIPFRKRIGMFMSYLIVASIGATLAMLYWWGMQKIFVSKESTQAVVSPEHPKQPTAEEIVAELAKKLPPQAIRQSPTEKKEYKEKEPTLELQLGNSVWMAGTVSDYNPATGTLSVVINNLSRTVFTSLSNWTIATADVGQTLVPVGISDTLLSRVTGEQNLTITTGLTLPQGTYVYIINRRRHLEPN